MQKNVFDQRVRMRNVPVVRQGAVVVRNGTHAKMKARD